MKIYDKFFMARDEERGSITLVGATINHTGDVVEESNPFIFGSVRNCGIDTQVKLKNHYSNLRYDPMTNKENSRRYFLIEMSEEEYNKIKITGGT